MNKLQKLNRRLLSNLKHLILGQPPQRQTQIASELLSNSKATMFKDALEYINYEKVPGDILEFGVFTGRTLATLTHLNQTETFWKFEDRSVVGFDWFQGLKGITEQHERWTDESCATNHEHGNPVAVVGAQVSPQLVAKFFAYYGLGNPNLEIGRYEETLPSVVGTKYCKAALVHIDCDLYESTVTVFSLIEPILQDGTIVLFDDWFHYRANPQRGEAKAFAEFLRAMNGKWQAVHYRQYGVFCNAFILSNNCST